MRDRISVSEGLCEGIPSWCFRAFGVVFAAAGKCPFLTHTTSSS